MNIRFCLDFILTFRFIKTETGHTYAVYKKRIKAQSSRHISQPMMPERYSRQTGRLSDAHRKGFLACPERLFGEAEKALREDGKGFSATSERSFRNRKERNWLTGSTLRKPSENRAEAGGMSFMRKQTALAELTLCHCRADYVYKYTFQRIIV